MTLGVSGRLKTPAMPTVDPVVRKLTAVHERLALRLFRRRAD